MITSSIVKEELQSLDYYINKLPQYLRASESFQEHFKIWYKILKYGIVDNADIMLNLLLIFDENYFDYLASVDETMTPTGNECDILEKIGSIFGVTRNFRITYSEGGVIHTNENINLNNEEFLILIKSQIIRNYCEGTREQIEKYYKSVGVQLYTETDNSDHATANLYLTTGASGTSYEYSDNIKKMFLAGLFTIESLGIVYTHSFIDVSRILFWDEGNTWGTTYYAPESGTITISGNATDGYTIVLNSTYTYQVDELAQGLVAGSVTEGTELGTVIGGQWIV